MAAVFFAACLERNSDFDGPASTSGSSTSGSSTSGGDAGATAGSTSDETAADTSTTDATCVPDGFEQEGEPAGQVTLGEHELVLESIDAIDRYNMFRSGEVPKTFHAAADADVRVCVYVQCDDSPIPADIDCVVGLSAAEPESATPGCCGGNTVDLSYICGGTTAAKVEIIVDMPPAACTPYTLVLAESAP
jgi:hypothetical protein